MKECIVSTALDSLPEVIIAMLHVERVVVNALAIPQRRYLFSQIHLQHSENQF